MLIELRQFIFPLITILVVNGLLVKIFKVKFGVSFPISLMVLPLIAFIIGLLSLNLYISVIICYIIVVIGLVTVIYSIIRDQEFRKNYFTVALISLGFIYIVIYIFNYGKYYLMWDEFTHWGPMVRGMVETNALYTDKAVNTIHKVYPPFIQLFEYLWIRLAGKYSEANVNIAIHLFQASIFSIFLVEYCTQERKRIYSIVMSIIIPILIIVANYTFDSYLTYPSIYIDILISNFAALIFVFINENLNDKVPLVFTCIGIFSFVLLKDVTMVFIIAFIIYIFIRLIFKIFLEKNFEKKDLFRFTIITIIGLAGYILWHIYIFSKNVTDYFSAKSMNLSKLIGIFKGIGTETQLKTLRLFHEGLISIELTTGFVNASFVFMLIFTLIILILIYIFNRKNFKLHILLSYILFILISAFGYYLIHLMLYMFMLQDYEMLGLGSFRRYFSTYVLFLYFMILYLIFKYLYLSEKLNFKMIILIIPLLIILDPIQITRFNKKGINDMHKDIRILADKLDYLQLKGKKIYLVLNDYINSTGVALSYYIRNNSINRNGINDKIFESTDYEIWQPIYDEIKNNDYLCIITSTNSVNEMLKELKEKDDQGNIEKFYLYSIILDDNGFTLGRFKR